MYLKFSHDDGEAIIFDPEDIITMELLCTNGNLPFNYSVVDFESEIPVPAIKISALFSANQCDKPYHNDKNKLENYFSVVTKLYFV